MKLRRRDGSPWRLLPALAWACTWGSGAGAGVALGGYLTLAGGEGTPGISALDPTTDLVVLPVVAFGTVVALYVVGSALAALVRGARPAREGGQGEADGEQAEDDGVTG